MTNHTNRPDGAEQESNTDKLSNSASGSSLPPARLNVPSVRPLVEQRVSELIVQSLRRLKELGYE